MSSLRRVGVVLVAIIVMMLGIPTAHAWGEEGHQIVGEIARARLSPQARAAIEELLGNDDLAKAGLWADQIRPNPKYDWAKPLHYVNVPRDALTIDLSRDCPTGECVVAAIGKFLEIAADQGKPKEERIEALKFAVHFIGDLHQPLHAGYKDDLGGNRITLTAPDGTRTNLHSVWDTLIIHTHTEGNWSLYARQLMRLASLVDDSKLASQLDPQAWANESAAQVRAIYAALPADGKITQEYCAENLPVVATRLTTGGIRMASALNMAFEGFPVPRVEGEAGDAAAATQPTGANP